MTHTEIEVLLFEAYVKLLNEKDEIKLRTENINEALDEIRDLLHASRYFKPDECTLSNEINHRQAFLNDIKTKDYNTKEVKDIITKYDYYGKPENLYDDYDYDCDSDDEDNKQEIDFIQTPKLKGLDKTLDINDVLFKKAKSKKQ